MAVQAALVDTDARLSGKIRVEVLQQRQDLRSRLIHTQSRLGQAVQMAILQPEVKTAQTRFFLRLLPRVAAQAE